MSSKTNQISSENENLCVLCFKNVEIYSVGLCDHPVCYECSTRMRVLCKQNECPICRADIPKVIFTRTVESFSSLFPKYSRFNLQDNKFGLIFESRDIQRAYERLLEHRCSICRNSIFRTFGQLKDHMRREHELFYCDICVENVRIFSTERRSYTRQELGMHRRKGDPDNTSHRGHPLCEFCDTRFMDSDELYRHLRRAHLFCHFCDADGKHLYYKCIEDLKKHFRDEHYLCEEGECRTMPMASAFRTDIDLKAHTAATHGRNLGKNASKQLRTLELAFTLAPRSNNRKRQGDSRADEEGAVGYEPGGPGGGQDLFHDPLTPMDFPALGGSSGAAVPQSRPQISFPVKSAPKLHSDDFPSLGNNSSRPSSAVTITTNRNSEVSISRTSNNFPALGKPASASRDARVTLSVHNNQDAIAPKVSIQVNHKPNGSFHTQITTTASSSNSQNQKPVEAFPALKTTSKTNVQQPQWVQVKSKKQAEKPSKVAPAPQLPPSDMSQFPNLSKGKTNKKTSSIKVPVTTDWANSNSLKKEQNNNNKINDAKKKEVSVKNKNEEKKTKNKEKPTENKVENGKTEPPKPPPGFKLPPPPGFENRINDFPCLGLPNDLTFTTSSGRSYAITSKENNYKQPSNFPTRNQNIMKKLTMVSGNDVVNEFKTRSELFRNGQLGAQKYYDYCKRVLGANFEDFFPEMLVLLPDIEKQGALYAVHTGKSRKNLVVCENCKQIIMKNELSEHYKYHSFENMFSSQVTTQANNNNSAWSNK